MPGQKIGLLMVCLIVVAGMGYLAWQVLKGERPGPDSFEVPLTLSADELARLEAVGANIFASDGCAVACHAEGRRVGGPLVNLASRYDVRTLSLLLANPPPPMPRFPYTEDDRRALSIYLLQNY
ncbi:MAG: hypothetical protein ACFHX7_05590 [Pseudomonadota bacterium]